VHTQAPVPGFYNPCSTIQLGDIIISGPDDVVDIVCGTEPVPTKVTTSKQASKLVSRIASDTAGWP
jgi:hypothetical protein